MSVRSTALMALVAAVSSIGVCATDTYAEIKPFYIGVDGLATVGGTYAGLENPNYNHLTFLYSHGDHYHSKAIQTYTGPNLGTDTAVIRSASDYVPEGTADPYALSAGSGLYTGKLVSPDLTIGSTDSLAGFDPFDDESILYNSSQGRWTPSPVGAHLHVALVGLTPGLNVGDASSLSIFSGVGDELHLDLDASTTLEFSPVLWTDGSAAIGTYEAVFRFFDEDGLFGDSGDVRFRVAVVPEPASLGLAGVAGLAMLRRRRAAM